MATKKTVTPKPKLTAEQRRAQREEAKRIAAEEEATALARFNEQRPQIWLQIWAKAMRIALLIPYFGEDFRERYTWWFDDFRVNPMVQSFQCSTQMGAITEQNLTETDAKTLNSTLDDVLDWHNAYQEEVERKRQEALEKQRRREIALSKLDDEDKVALDLPLR